MMIDIRPDDVTAERRTSDGRFAVFTCTDLPSRCPLPFWGVTLDTGGDGHGLLVRLGEQDASEGWTALDLLQVVLARAKAEEDRRPDAQNLILIYHLSQALRAERQRSGSSCSAGGPTYRVGHQASPYPWTVAQRFGRTLPLCPDPASREEGVTPEQLCIVLDEIFSSASAVNRINSNLRAARRHIGHALGAEVHRVTRIRSLLLPIPTEEKKR